MKKENDSSSDSSETIAGALKGPNPFRIGLAIGTLVTVSVVLLIVQNGESARLDWLAFHFSSPLWIMLVLTLIAGAIVWESLKVGWRRGRQNQRQRRAALQAAKDIAK